MYLRTGNRLVAIGLSDILFIQVSGRFCEVVLPDRVFQTDTSLRKITRHLCANDFFRVHQSFLVNGHKIESIDLKKNLIVVGPHTRIPIGPLFRNDFLKSLEIILSVAKINLEHRNPRTEKPSNVEQSHNP